MRETKMKSTTTIALLFVILSLPISTLSQSFGASYIPNSPAELHFNERVRIRFSYDHRKMGEQVLFITPYTNGEPTPNATTRTPSVLSGIGIGETYFTVQGGVHVNVDSLRFRFTYADRIRVMYEYFRPVDYTFTSAKN